MSDSDSKPLLEPPPDRGGEKDDEGPHNRRHVIMDSAIFIFVFFGLWVVIDPGNICDLHGARMPDVNNSTWQLQYISGKIANCKGDGFDPVYFREWLPWIAVFFFPFIMIQFQLVYNTIVRETILHVVPVDEEEAVKDARTRATRDGIQKPKAVSARPWMLSSRVWTLCSVAVFLLESFCVGGFFWLVYYIHTGPHRWWHAVATVTLFSCATILNIILCVIYTVYKRETARNPYWYKVGAIYILMLLQMVSVISFIWAFVLQSDEDEQDVAITLEYIVAVIWFMTVLLDCLLYRSIRDPQHSKPLPTWSCSIMSYYAGFCVVGIGLVRLMLESYPKT